MRRGHRGGRRNHGRDPRVGLCPADAIQVARRARARRRLHRRSGLGQSRGPGNPVHPWLLAASLSWARQTSSELAKEFHIVTYDLRGHGNSDKPLEPEKYKESKGWADEVKTVMETAKLKRPVLVGWSYGGGVIADYLKLHGAGT